MAMVNNVACNLFVIIVTNLQKIALTLDKMLPVKRQESDNVQPDCVFLCIIRK